MALPFFTNAVNSGMTPDPNTYYRDLQQAFINDQWDNTAVLATIQTQAAIGSSEYNDVEVWTNRVIADSTTGRKNGNDFVQITFQSIDYSLVRGWMYQYQNNYWLAYFLNEFSNIVKDASLRRCNNYMKIIDPENGALFSIPCVVDYDMSSPSVQTSTSIITANNHASIMVQGNADTMRLFKTNTRYILGGRPFKLYGIQNAIYDDATSDIPTLLYLDLYLDEIRANDNLETGVADNGEYVYTIAINSDNMELTTTSTGILTADVALNGKEVAGSVIWSSSDDSVVTITALGAYDVVGAVGTTATITASLEGNSAVADSITITVVDQQAITPLIIVDPSFTKIREYETIECNIVASYGGTEYSPSVSSMSLSADSAVLSNSYMAIVKNGNQYSITCTQRTLTPQTLYITVQNTAPSFEANTMLAVHLASMMG